MIFYQRPAQRYDGLCIHVLSVPPIWLIFQDQQERPHALAEYRSLQQKEAWVTLDLQKILKNQNGALTGWFSDYHREPPF